MSKTLRVRTRAGWTTKPVEDLPENRLTAGEVDDNFLALEDQSVPRGTVTDTSTSIATLYTLPTHNTSVLNVRPSGASTGVYAAHLAIASLDQNPITGGGHIIGQLGVVETKVDCQAAYAVEGRIEPLAGNVNISAAFIAAAQTVSGGALGTVALHADFLSNNFDDHAYIGQKYTLLNVDPGKVLQTAGEAIVAGQKVLPRQMVSPTTNRYYTVAAIHSLGDAATVRGFAIAAPFISPGRIAYNRIGCQLITGVASGTARLGVYADANGMPGDLILDAGTVAITAGSEGNREITINLPLEAGAYWLAINVEGGADPTLKWALTHSYNVTGWVTPGVQHAFVFKATAGALPATMADGSWFENTATPLVWLRAV